MRSNQDQNKAAKETETSNLKSLFYSFLKPLAIVTTALTIGLLIAEITFRILGLGWPTMYVYLRDENVGNVLKPNTEFEWNQEGNAFIKINSRGLRDKEHQIPKPENTWRFAVLGDSMAEALQVDMNDTFWAEIEITLNKCTALKGKKVEAVNFGVSGHGTAQELITLRNRVWEYEPEMVLLAITNGNDIRNNSPDLEPNTTRPFFTKENDGLILDNSFREILMTQADLHERPAWQKATINLLNKTRVGQLILKAGRQIRENSNQSDLIATNEWEPGMDYQVFAPPINEKWIDAWWVTEQLILKMYEEVTERGVLFDSFMIPSGIQVDFDDEKRFKMATSLGVEELSYPERRIDYFAKTNEIPFLPLLEPFLEYSKDTKEYLFGFKNASLGEGHLNEKGHNLAGNIISKRICKKLKSH